jgi:hypothetical protein
MATTYAANAVKDLTEGIKITRRKAPLKSPVYTGADLTQLLNEKFNWLCANTHAVFTKQNARLHGLLKMMASQPKSILGGYEAMLLLQEATPREEGILLMILRDMKKRTSDAGHILSYRFEFDRDGDEDGEKYDDYALRTRLDGYTMLILAAKQGLWKIAKYLFLADGEDATIIHQEVFEKETTCDQSARPKGEPRLTGKYHSIYTYALAAQVVITEESREMIEKEEKEKISFLTVLFQKFPAEFWERTRTTPQDLVENLKSRTAHLNHMRSPVHRDLLTKIFTLMEMIVVAHPDHFVDNQLYLDFARNHQNEALLAMLRYGEINPMYTDKTTGNTAFIYAARTRNLELFEMLLYSMPLSHLVQKNGEGKAAIDYLPASSKVPKVQQMGAMLRSYLKFLLERPKLVIMNGKDTIYLNPNISEREEEEKRPATEAIAGEKSA